VTKIAAPGLGHFDCQKSIKAIISLTKPLKKEENLQHYSSHIFQLPREFLLSVNRLDPKRSYFALASTWAILALLIFGYRFLLPSEYAAMAYVPVIFLIAGRFGALLQLAHEGAHGLLSRSRERNRFLSRFLISYPIGVFFEGYASGHMRHHSGTNTDKDPKADTEKYRVCDFRNPQLYLLLLKDLLGLTAFEVFFAYKKYEQNTPQVKQAPEESFSKIRTLGYMSIVNLVVLGAFFQFNIPHYIFLWLIPAVSPHMFLMRIRGIAEHGLSKQVGVTVTRADQGNLYTRSFFTDQNRYAFFPIIWLERTLIGSLAVNHHHEHHLFPTVPFYHLRTVHKRIAPEVIKYNPDVYAKGYFAAATRTLWEPVEVQLPGTAEMMS
jgi:fatty acid desaturase